MTLILAGFRSNPLWDLLNSLCQMGPKSALPAPEWGVLPHPCLEEEIGLHTEVRVADDGDRSVQLDSPGNTCRVRCWGWRKGGLCVCGGGMGCHSEAGWECDVMDLEVMDVLLFSCCFLATFL